MTSFVTAISVNVRGSRPWRGGKTEQLVCCFTLVPDSLALAVCAVENLPWLRASAPRLAYVISLYAASWSRKLENKLKALIEEVVPRFSSDLLRLNYESDSLHMRFLREAFRTQDTSWFARASQLGSRCASFPLLFDWADFSPELRKYVCFCFMRFFQGRSQSLALLPCSTLQLIDFLSWLPSAGLNVGWTSIRHYASQVQTFSQVCGFGSIREEDERGFQLWKDNFKANIKVIRAARGGDLPLKPWLLRYLGTVFSSGSSFDLMMLAVMSNMWFTALRPGHFSPDSRKPEACKHMLQWGFLHPYKVGVTTVMRLDVPTAKNAQAESASPWATATACICQGYTDCTPEEHEELSRLCPTCSLFRWHAVYPAAKVKGSHDFVFVDPASGEPILRSRFNQILRDALAQAFSHLPPEELEQVLKMFSAKSWRSGAGTVLVTAGSSGLVAAAFLAHGCVEITQKYYHKGGDFERLQQGAILAGSLRT